MSREEVAEAAWRVIVRDGLPRTSVRAIARELNATTGVVTYYFREKAELMLFALDRLCAAILRDLDAAVEGRLDVDRIRAILETTLPIGPKEAAGWRIWIAFVGVATSNKRLREEHQRRLEILSRRLGEEVAALQAAGKAPNTLDPKAEADALIAFSDGIGLSWVLRPRSYPPDRQREMIDWYLGARFGATSVSASARGSRRGAGR